MAAIGSIFIKMLFAGLVTSVLLLICFCIYKAVDAFTYGEAVQGFAWLGALFFILIFLSVL